MTERPLCIWVDFLVRRNAGGKTAEFTTGMESLGHMEFETVNSPEPPQELRDRFYKLANHVLHHGPVIRGGELSRA